MSKSTVMTNQGVEKFRTQNMQQNGGPSLISSGGAEDVATMKMVRDLDDELRRRVVPTAKGKYLPITTPVLKNL